MIKGWAPTSKLGIPQMQNPDTDTRGMGHSYKEQEIAQGLNRGHCGHHTPLREGLVSPVLDPAEELPTIQAGREAAGLGTEGACQQPQLEQRQTLWCPARSCMSSARDAAPLHPHSEVDTSRQRCSRNERGRGFACAAEMPGTNGRGLPTKPQKHIYSKDSKML